MRSAAIFALVFCVACSAKVNPDPALLGPRDFRDAGQDAGDASVDIAVDAPPVCPSSCDDDIDCTVDSCVDGACVSQPSNELCGDGQVCTVGGCETPVQCTDASDCVDQADCTQDLCVEGVCQNQPIPEFCQDDFACTVDVCTPEGCRRTLDNSVCAQQDLCVVGSECTPDGCQGGEKLECNDDSACTMDTCDSRTGDCVFQMADVDGDGFFAEQVNGEPCGGNDCDDDNLMINPDRAEVCDGVDNNCQDGIDEGCTNDTCGAVQEISLMGSSEVVINGSFRDYRNTQTTPCANNGPDAFYYIDVPNDLDLELTLEGRDTVLSVSEDSCAALDGTPFCHDDIDSQGNLDSRIWIHNLDGATGDTQRLYIRVASVMPNDDTDFELTVTPFEKESDRCSGGTIGIRFGAIFGRHGNANIHTGTCGGFNQPEVIFRVRSNHDDDLVELVAPMAGRMYIRAGCSLGSFERGCQRGPGTLDVPNANNNERHVYLDGGTTGEPFFARFRRRGTEN